MSMFGPWIGWATSAAMGHVVNLRNRGFDKGKHVHDVGVPVVSVGNVSVGGTGKTPMVRWIVRHLLSAGHHPAIAIRGYKAKDGRSDEAIEHQTALPDVPVLVGANRVRTIARAAQAGTAFDCVVLDDGFQHRFVKRDLDVVLVDARRPPDTDRLLPAGRLRERPTALQRADAVVITHADHAAPTLIERLTELHGKPPLASCVHCWQGLRRIAPDGPTHLDVEALNGMRVVTRLALARPKGIRRMLSEHGAEVVGDLYARDHQAATLADLDELATLASNADAIVVSAKDMATMEPLLNQRVLPVPLLVPDLTMRFLSGEDAFANRINAVFNGDEP